LTFKVRQKVMLIWFISSNLYKIAKWVSQMDESKSMLDM
jgi:hypothetical protein